MSHISEGFVQTDSSTLQSLRENPFAVQSPETMTAQDTIDLFVDVFTDFYKVNSIGHAFIHGARGSGKSMMFRYLLPDCQLLARKCSLKELPFWGVHIPIKKTDLKITELSRLLNHNANTLLNEHFMCIHIILRVLFTLPDLESDDTGRTAIVQYIDAHFLPLLKQSGWHQSELDNPLKNSQPKSFIIQICNDIHANLTSFLRRLAFNQNANYDGPLCGYLDFLVPALVGLKNLPFMPNGPIYLMIDDADNLNTTQTMILNSWVSTRTQNDICLKISTQLRYKTYRTITGDFIEAPHDYQEVNILTRYTSSKNVYAKRVSDIVQKRLNLAQIDATPESFFPCDIEQERKIQDIADQLRASWETEGRGNRPSDDVLRYARPTFITNLKNQGSMYSYSYAGFDQLVHISSGVIRYFLDAASLMFSDERARSTSADGAVNSISPSIQNQVVRNQANDLMFKEFEKIKEDEQESDDPENTIITNHNLRLLGNLIQALGGMFHLKLLSNDADRRVFSFALSDVPNDEIIKVLRLGIQHGYFHESTIGNKDGTGRTRLYVLTRRLAPHFTLDPSSFAGYQFMTCAKIREAMENPSRLLRSLKTKGVDNYLNPDQPQLSFEEDI